jgi:hypothetical protein
MINMGFVEFVGWFFIFLVLINLALMAPGLTFMLILLGALVGLALLPFIVLGLALEKE